MADAKAARCHHRRRHARNPARAIRTGSVTYTSPRTLKTLATAVSGGARPEIISRSHASSSRWTRPVALGDLARLVDAHHHPRRLVVAVAKLGDQDRQPQLGVVLNLNRESGRRRRLGLLRGPCHLLVSLHDHSSL